MTLNCGMTNIPLADPLIKAIQTLKLFLSYEKYFLFIEWWLFLLFRVKLWLEWWLQWPKGAKCVSQITQNICWNTQNLFCNSQNLSLKKCKKSFLKKCTKCFLKYTKSFIDNAPNVSWITSKWFFEIKKIFPKECTKRFLHYANSFPTNTKCYVKYAKFSPK